MSLPWGYHSWFNWSKVHHVLLTFMEILLPSKRNWKVEELDLVVSVSLNLPIYSNNLTAELHIHSHKGSIFICTTYHSSPSLHLCPCLFHKQCTDAHTHSSNIYHNEHLQKQPGLPGYKSWQGSKRLPDISVSFHVLILLLTCLTFDKRSKMQFW